MGQSVLFLRYNGCSSKSDLAGDEQHQNCLPPLHRLLSAFRTRRPVVESDRWMPEVLIGHAKNEKVSRWVKYASLHRRMTCDTEMHGRKGRYSPWGLENGATIGLEGK
jgi:hypothetical protein